MRLYRKKKVRLFFCLFFCLFLASCGKNEENVSDTVSAKECEVSGHDMEIRWYGEPPDCVNGGYRALICKRCGWVDEKAGESTPPLGHTPVEKELYHGNCREDTVIVYICSVCGEKTGYDRHPEEEEHEWIRKETTVWDEETMSFQKKEIQCCKRCNIRPGEER